MSSEKLYKVRDDVYEEYKKFKLGRKYKWVTFGVETESGGQKVHVVKETESDKNKGVEELIESLPGHDCRYVVYEHEYKTKDGRKTDKLFFINWNPRAAATTVQMDYLTGRTYIREVCDGVFDVSATTSADIREGILGDRAESDEDEVAGDNDDWLDE